MPLRYVKLSLEEKLALEDSYKTYAERHFREKCHALLLSDKGYKIPELALMLKKHCEYYS